MPCVEAGRGRNQMCTSLLLVSFSFVWCYHTVRMGHGKGRTRTCRSCCLMPLIGPCNCCASWGPCDRQRPSPRWPCCSCAQGKAAEGAHDHAACRRARYRGSRKGRARSTSGTEEPLPVPRLKMSLGHRQTDRQTFHSPYTSPTGNLQTFYLTPSLHLGLSRGCRGL